MDDSSEPFRLSLISQDAFREIFQSMTEGIIAVSKEGEIIVANLVAENMFGYDKNELVGKPLEMLLPKRYRGSHIHFRTEFNQNPIPRKMGQGRDLAALTKGGIEFPVEISLSYSNAGSHFHAIAFISNISLRKKAEEALKRSEEQLIQYAAELENRVQARTEDLNISIKKLEKEIIDRKKAEAEVRRALDKERELNEMKSKFVSIASHEFRTPLSTILSSIALIDQYKQKGDIEKIDKHISRAKASVNHLTGILNDLLSLSKLEEGKMEVLSEDVHVKELFSDIAEEIRLLLKPGQEIVMTCATALESLQTDGRILRNILFNLLSNASKYSDHGKSIYLECKHTDTIFEITIRDEGMGVPEAEQRHLFERFFRASNASNIQGTGLGLNIVKRYLDLLSGTVTFSSEYLKGSTFTIQLPIRKS